MSDGFVGFSIDIEVGEEGVEAALLRMRRVSDTVLKELRKRRRDGPKPSEKRRNKHWFRRNRGRKWTYAGGWPFSTSVSVTDRRTPRH